MDVSAMETVLSRLEGIADRLEKAAPAAAPGATSSSKAAPAGAAAAADAAIAVSFDAFCAERVAALSKAAKETDAADVLDGTEMLVLGLKMLRQVLAATGICSKPKDTDWKGLLTKVMELGGKAQKLCDNRSDFFQNRKAIAEALNVVTLVTSPSPPLHVQNVLESMDFHLVKVMQKKVPAETAWSKALKELVKDLKEWCSQECKLGPTWTCGGTDPVAYFSANPLGSDPAPAAAAAPGPKGKGRGAAPPPPKGGFQPPPPEVLAKLRGDGAPKAAGGAGMTAVFDAINNFTTSNLKRVTDDMKTKNQVKDGPSTVPAATAKAKAGPSKTTGKGPRGAPIFELQKELNWIIENQDGVSDLVLEDAQKQHLVCMINCRNCTLQIKTRVKSISIDGCEKVNVICQDVISAVELVNSDRCQVQTLGKVNSFAIDKCNGVNLFFSKESLEAEIVTSKSSEMNVTIPDPAGDVGDTVELPVPEQFVTKLVGPKKLQTEVSSLYSS